MAKKLIINCGDCDARFVKEETLENYESITINCGTVLTTPESRGLMNRYNVAMNCGDVLEIEKDVKVAKINGSAQIKSSDQEPEGRQYMFVNGSLEIGPDTQRILSKYVGISVNGSVTYPESLSGFMSMLDVNGSVNCYPDGAIVLKRTAVIDRLFALRAKDSLYWSGKRMIMVDPQLDPAALARKGARFSSKEIIMAEGTAEAMIDRIDEKAEIIVVPDGTAVITDDAEMSDLLLKKHGTKLYILGDLTVHTAAAAALEQLEYLNVRGDVLVDAEVKELLMLKLTDIGGDVQEAKPVRGRRISDKMSLRLSKWLLEQEKDGISVSDCVRVSLDEDITPEMILNKLSFSDCMTIRCTPEQESAVAAVAEDVMNIGMGEDGGAAGLGGMIENVVSGALNGAKQLLDTKIINAGEYVL